MRGLSGRKKYWGNLARVGEGTVGCGVQSTALSPLSPGSSSCLGREGRGAESVQGAETPGGGSRLWVRALEASPPSSFRKDM